MARIRTIKPEFFTSEDIVSVSPIARLLYVGLWCEADREGRLVWKPGTLKLRYLPGEQADFDRAAAELIDRKMLVLYGAGYCVIPTFLLHQRPNPREAKSTLPSPQSAVDSVDKSGRDYPQLHAANLDLHAQGGREGREGNGKGKEGGVETPHLLNGQKGRLERETAHQKHDLTPGWWNTREGCLEAGQKLGVDTRPGEELQAFKDRIFAHIRGEKAA